MPFTTAFHTLRRRLFGGSLVAAFFAALLTFGLLAAAPARADDTDTALDAIRAQLDSAQKSLKDSDKLDAAALQSLRSGALAALAQASDIAIRLAPQLAGLDARVAELGTPVVGAKEDADVVSQRAALAKNRVAFDGQAKLARLLVVESQQLADQTWALRRSQFQARLGERAASVLAPAFWVELHDDLPRDADRLAALASEFSSAARMTPLRVWLLAPLALAVAVGLLAWLRNRLMRWLTTRVPVGRLRRSLRALLVVLHSTLTMAALALALGAVVDSDRSLPSATAALVSASLGMLWFSGFVYGLTNALVCAKRPSWRLLPLPDAVALALRWFPLQIAIVSFVTWFAERLVALLNASLAMTVAVNCAVALAMGLTIVSALMRGERLWRREIAESHAHALPIWLPIIAGLNWLILVTAVGCLLAGFVAFGSFAIKQLVWIGIVLGTAYLLAAVIDDLLMAWLATSPKIEGDDETGPVSVKGTAQLAVLASGVLRLALLLFALILVIAPFGEGPADLVRRGGQWQQSLAIGEFKLQPAAVLQALAVLLLGLGAVRVLRGWLTERYLPTTSLDPGMRASATSLFGYAGVIVAASLAMSAMGIGLERIAWVASALSVGIGFGLQAVVQNFVSGLILLAERPVKVGDWVSLGGVEGDIRRINVRATEIQMGDRSTVIVPNSEFITKVVRNVTLENPLGLVQLKLPVPLRTDAEQVRELLLAAFTANGDLLDAPAPSVNLDGIEGGQLVFNATGFVESPRKSYGVKSAVLFDVLKRLKDAGITLSAPPTMLMAAPAEQAAQPALPASSASPPP